MTILTSTITLLAALSLTAACASDDAADPSATTNTGGSTSSTATGGSGGTDGAPVDEFPPCGAGENNNCVPSGFPFASLAFAHSNSCEGTCTSEPDPFGHPPPEGTTISMTQPESGTLCLTGENPTDETGLDLGLSVLQALENKDLEVVEVFNAELLGITHVRFTIEGPPSAGVFVRANTLTKLVCHDFDCVIWGFEPPDSITENGQVTLAFAEFSHEEGFEFDSRAIVDLSFDVGPGVFDFCISDFEFLDADGNVVPEP